MRLGRRPHIPDLLAAAPAHRFAAMMPPAAVDRSLTDIVPGLYGNDSLPDCTFVSMANAARCIAHLNGFDLVVDPDRVPAAYAECAGVSLDQAAATDGVRMLDVLDYQQRLGFNVGPQVLCAIGGTVPVHRMALAQAIDRLGPVWCGVTLHERETEAWGAGTVWDVEAGRDDGAEVGGHAVTLWAYKGLGDGSQVWLSTWGVWQAVTWAWIDRRMDEAHGLVWRQLARADGSFYAGLTADGLVRDLDQ